MKPQKHNGKDGDSFGLTLDHIQHEVMPQQKDIEFEFDLNMDDLKISAANEKLSKEFHIEREDYDNESNDIDKLEDEFIDHIGSPKSLDLDSSTDELQKSLDERADQIGNESFRALPKKPVINFHYEDSESLITEINDWFIMAELKQLALQDLSNVFEQFGNSFKESDSDSITSQMRLMSNILVNLKKAIKKKDTAGQLIMLNYVSYLSFGTYKGCTNAQEQLFLIKRNNILLYECGILPIIAKLVIDIINAKIENDPSSDNKSGNIIFFRSLTLLYFLINVFLDEGEGEEKDKFTEELSKFDLLTYFVKFMEVWRWVPKVQFRIRNILLLFWKLLLLEFGGTTELGKAKQFLHEKNGITKNSEPNKLTLSPLDYYVFREDLTSRYPGFNLPQPLKANRLHNDYKLENSNSLSKLIDIPRPLRTHVANNQLPTPEIHFSTPAPSPPSTPIPSNKPKKSFQLNQNYPFIYPVSDDDEDNDSIPYSIMEANELVSDRVYTKLSIKQLWDERDKFMKQERGWVNSFENGEMINEKNHKWVREDKNGEFNDSNGSEHENGKEESNKTNTNTNQADEEYRYNENTIKEYPQYKNQIKSLIRVEDFYRKNLSNFKSLVYVFNEIIKSNNFKADIASQDRQYDESLLELIAQKEITLKATSGILILLLKWLKKSHICKFMYFTTLIFDNDYIDNVLTFIGSQNYKDSDKLLNPAVKIPAYEFFNNCLNIPKHKLPTINLVNSLNQDNLFMVTTIENYNWRYCFIVNNLTAVLKRILLNKSQRIITLIDKNPTGIFRNILNKYEITEIYKPILKTVKLIIAYQGRKWKSQNMDLISLIYLQLKLKLKDHWLSGKDIEGELRDAYGQEVAIRALLQYYNIKNYKDKMGELGYEIVKNSFYTREMDNLSEWNNE